MTRDKLAIAELRQCAIRDHNSNEWLGNAAYYAQANQAGLNDCRVEHSDQSRMFLLLVAASLQR